MPVSLLLAPAGSLITAPAGGCSMCAGNVGVRGAVRMVATAEPTMSASWTKMDKMKSRYGGLIFQPDENLVGDDIGFSYDEMSAQMQEIISYTRGDTCTGTILGFEPNGALVDIGVKSSAYCTVREAAPRPFAPLSFIRLPIGLIAVRRPNVCAVRSSKRPFARCSRR